VPCDAARRLVITLLNMVVQQLWTRVMVDRVLVAIRRLNVMRVVRVVLRGVRLTPQHRQAFHLRRRWATPSRWARWPAPAPSCCCCIPRPTVLVYIAATTGGEGEAVASAAG
jgi:hypothetical protein